jgi:hypothetical protein
MVWLVHLIQVELSQWTVVADDASRLAGLKQVTVLPLASDTLPFKDETAKRKPARTSNTRSKVAKRAPEVSEVGAGLPAPLLSELEGPYPAELSDLFVSFSESHQEQGWASLELSTQLNAAETTPAMGMGNNAHFLINGTPIVFSSALPILRYGYC